MGVALFPDGERTLWRGAATGLIRKFYLVVTGTLNSLVMRRMEPDILGYWTRNLFGTGLGQGDGGTSQSLVFSAIPVH
jgi:hypothetical protein